MRDLNRRGVIGLVGGAAVWPAAVGAQQGERVRRIGVLSALSDNEELQIRLTAFREALQQRGWSDGRNVRIDVRLGAGDADTIRKGAAELVALAPDVIVASSGAVLGRLLQTTRAVPIVFVVVPDPVGSGFVDSLSRPGGNATGFMQFEYSLSGKWLELLREIGPRVTRALVIWNPAVPAGIGQFAIIQSVAPALGIEVIPLKLHDVAETELTIAAFARAGNGGLIVTAASATTGAQRELMITLAARHKLSAVYPNRDFVARGGLMSSPAAGSMP